MDVPWKRSDWNDVIERVNDLIDGGCTGTKLSLVGTNHKWSVNDIELVRNKLSSMCSNPAFATELRLWSQDVIDEINDVIATCVCCDLGEYQVRYTLPMQYDSWNQTYYYVYTYPGGGTQRSWLYSYLASAYSCGAFQLGDPDIWVRRAYLGPSYSYLGELPSTGEFSLTLEGDFVAPDPRTDDVNSNYYGTPKYQWDAKVATADRYGWGISLDSDPLIHLTTNVNMDVNIYRGNFCLPTCSPLYNLNVYGRIPWTWEYVHFQDYASMVDSIPEDKRWAITLKYQGTVHNSGMGSLGVHWFLPCQYDYFTYEIRW